MGPFEVSQGSLLIAAVVVTIPALMIVVSAAAPFPLVRWLSLGVGVLYMLVSVSNLVGESWAYYLVIGVLEIGLAGLVVAYSYRWRGGARRRRRAGRPSRARAEEVALAMDYHAPPNQAV